MRAVAENTETTMITPKELNEINHRYWAREHARLIEQLGDDALRDGAFELMNGELRRRVPARSQLSMYDAFTEADAMRRRFSTAHARKGGKAPKADALQLHIVSLVERQPSITCRELERQLRNYAGIPPIEDVEDDKIWFTNHNRVSNSAPMTGLKDRLTRAKKKFARANWLARKRVG
jgi:hypothetical protein